MQKHLNVFSGTEKLEDLATLGLLSESRGQAKMVGFCNHIILLLASLLF